ncbi:MAG: phosphotransferase [Rhizobiales bacterium]|nr:phosphotransferase [Hyphomicrobiales bacterium]
MSDQDEIIAFLQQGSAYGKPKEEVSRIDTHAAMIFLVGDRAFKVKRAVRYDFLDFSTLEKRKDALEAELRLNRRTAPKLYRRTLPVCRDDDGLLTLDGDGKAVEWLLVMRRFDQAGLLDKLALAGDLDPEVMEPLAAAIADLHEQAEARTDGGGYDAMKEVIRGNHEDLAEARAKGMIEQDVEWLHAETSKSLDDHRQHLDRRRKQGFVRHCHGDLHLGNIVLIDKAPILFDCLEFDENLAIIDTFYDLALLLMDLCHRDLRPLAQRLLNDYLELTGDDEGTALLPLFIAMRAAMRAKVGALKAEQIEQGDDRRAVLEDVADYLDLARRALRPEPPILLAIGGVSGTGKRRLPLTWRRSSARCPARFICAAT